MDDSAPVAFVHGLIGTLQEPDLVGFFDKGRAIAPDLVGYGRFRDAPPDEVHIPAQVAHLHRTIESAFGSEQVHLVGHSIGGAVAALYSFAYPETVKSLVSVEGNFTLKDAFWSASVARMTPEQADEMLAGFRQDPAAWLARSGIPPEPRLVEIAARWLARQPASTIRAMAQSVVAETEPDEYLQKVRSIFTRLPVHLVCGEHSQGGWDAPEWAIREAKSFTVVPGVGHLLMLERPAEFAATIKIVLY
jgi:pimeloyl-ACP methyl ester carboxylesterase